MKKMKLFLSAIFLLGGMFCSNNVMAQQVNHDEFANFKRYAADNQKLGAPAPGEKRVVFMGNSITDNWSNHTRPEFFAQNNLIGRGISGQTSYQFVLRFREDVINLQPAVVVINYGTNDIAENTGPYNEDHTYGNVLTMVDMARANGAKVILTSCLPAGNIPWNKKITGSMEKVRQLNARVKAYAEAQQIPYVDYFTALLSADGSRLDERYSGDGIHPNAAGYEVMEALILPVIEKLR